jgi:hypothetical protein
MVHSTGADTILLTSLRSYFDTHPSVFLSMCDICKGHSLLSLRVLDWLCTNYSKSRTGLLTDSSNIDLYHKYKNNLKGFGKRYFDPFCRRTILELTLHDRTMQTTLGQLNFFKWAFENNVIAFAKLHKQEIEVDMNARTHKTEAVEHPPRKHRRSQLSDLASNHCHKRIKRIRVSFS